MVRKAKFGRSGMVLAVAVAATAMGAGPGTRLYAKGILYGTVLDASGKPVSGATVALQQANGKILGWSLTNEKGQYAIPGDPKVALNLYSHHRSLFEQCMKAVGDVAMVPVRAVGSIVTQPGPMVRSGAASVASGTPTAIVGQTLQYGLPGQGTVGQTEKSAGGAATYTALGGTPPAALPTSPGKTTILISAPGFNSTQLQPTAYWMEGSIDSKTTPIGLRAWLETVKISPANGKEKAAVQPEVLTVSNTSIEPRVVPAGKTVKISTVLSSPPGPSRQVRVFARESGKGTVIELSPGADHKTYSGEMTIDPKSGVGETTITVGVLRVNPVEIRLDPKKPDPLPEFCRRLDEMSAKKPYVYDPLTMGAVNREDVKVTILGGTPTAPPKD